MKRSTRSYLFFLIRLGPGPYGLPYRFGEPNIRHTLWERDPKQAMSQTLLNLAEVKIFVAVMVEYVVI